MSLVVFYAWYSPTPHIMLGGGGVVSGGGPTTFNCFTHYSRLSSHELPVFPTASVRASSPAL